MKNQIHLSLAKSLVVLGALVLGLSSSHAQNLVRLHGAVTMEKLITAQKQAIESQTGTRLEVVGNGSGRGLSDLCAGLADVAMIGGSLKGVAEATNQEKPGSAKTDGMVETPITALKLVFITHPGVGVKTLTAAQLGGLLTGKTTNWKDAGGADLPVKVVLPFPGDGGRISVQESILAGAEYAKTAILRNTSKDIVPVVSQLPGSCSIITAKNAEGAAIALVSGDKDLCMPVQLVTKAKPSDEVSKVVAAVKALIK